MAVLDGFSAQFQTVFATLCADRNLKVAIALFLKRVTRRSCGSTADSLLLLGAMMWCGSGAGVGGAFTVAGT